MIDEDYEARKAKLVQRTEKLLQNISKFDTDKSSAKDLLSLYKELDILHEGFEDLVNEIEVEDFLLNGPGKKDGDKYEK